MRIDSLTNRQDPPVGGTLVENLANTRIGGQGWCKSSSNRRVVLCMQASTNSLPFTVKAGLLWILVHTTVLQLCQILFTIHRQTACTLVTT